MPPVESYESLDNTLMLFWQGNGGSNLRANSALFFFGGFIANGWVSDNEMMSQFHVEDK